MRFELRHIRSFIALAEELHFRKAAERLYMTQPGLTRTIKWLEEEIGTALFVRSTRSVALTDAGHEFLGECRQALEGLQRGVRKARHAAAGEVGTLTVAYMDFAINGPLPELLRVFHEQKPRVHVELVYMPSSRQKEAILADQVDIGLLIGPFVSRSVSTLSVQKETLTVLLPEAHALARQSTVALSQLTDQPFVLGYRQGWSSFRNKLFRTCQAAGFTPDIVQEAATSDGILGMVAANSGISVYTESAYNISRRGVVVRPLVDSDLEVETLAAWKTRVGSPVAMRFLECLKGMLSDDEAVDDAE